MKVENVTVLPPHIMVPHEKLTEKKFQSDCIDFSGATWGLKFYIFVFYVKIVFIYRSLELT